METNGGPRYIHGHPHTVVISVVLCLVVAILMTLRFGAEGVLLFALSVLPVLAILTGIRYLAGNDLPREVMLELFWTGATLSIVLAVVLEIVGQIRTRPAWRCLDNKNDQSFCEVQFTIAIIVTVGFAEELSKLVPLMRLRSSAYDCPHSHTWWYRVCTTPLGFFLAGCSSGAGFACVENIKYVFSSDQFGEQLGTALLRAVLSVPAHVAYTGTAAGILALSLYPVRGTELADGLLTGSPEELQGMKSELGLLRVLGALSVPSLLHGVYDAGLFIASKYFKLASPTEGPEPPFADDYRLVGGVAVGSALLLYLVALGVAGWVGWKTSKRTERLRGRRLFGSGNSIEVATVESPVNSP